MTMDDSPRVIVSYLMYRHGRFVVVVHGLYGVILKRDGPLTPISGFPARSFGVGLPGVLLLGGGERLVRIGHHSSSNCSHRFDLTDSRLDILYLCPTHALI